MHLCRPNYSTQNLYFLYRYKENKTYITKVPTLISISFSRISANLGPASLKCLELRCLSSDGGKEIMEITFYAESEGTL